MKYGIFGASGAVGQALGFEMPPGTRFAVVGRSEDRLRREFSRFEPNVEYRVADLSDPDAARKAAEGIETLIYTVGVPYTQFEMHPRLTRVALEAAASAGVQRYVHVSTVYPYGRPQKTRVDEFHPREPHTFKGRMRKEQEDLVLAANGRDGMRTTLVRPPDFYGPRVEASFVKSIFDAAMSGGRAKVIGPIDTPHEFIFVPDLARVILALADKPDAYGQPWNIAGPRPTTTREFAKLVYGALGKKPKLMVAGGLMLR
ncbi:MAG TPA: NAD-dependent epimerase/dehydratase family protein, partial [Bryobacteraceae bacterium]|nr:NAD-dependent epimerase/dehydratase family protein [Bryobacteraceae bacterium]